MKLLAALVATATIATAVQVPEDAQAGSAVPTLTAGEAARVVGRALHREFDGVVRGSLRARCFESVRPNFRRCAYSYYTNEGACWIGAMGVRENWERYTYRIIFDDRCPA